MDYTPTPEEVRGATTATIQRRKQCYHLLGFWEIPQWGSTRDEWVFFTDYRVHVDPDFMTLLGEIWHRTPIYPAEKGFHDLALRKAIHTSRTNAHGILFDFHPPMPEFVGTYLTEELRYSEYNPSRVQLRKELSGLKYSQLLPWCANLDVILRPTSLFFRRNQRLYLMIREDGFMADFPTQNYANSLLQAYYPTNPQRPPLRTHDHDTDTLIDAALEPFRIQLYPYQRRGISWLMKCETERMVVYQPLFHITDRLMTHMAFTTKTGVADSPLVDRTHVSINGGVLTWPMGMGKTIGGIVLSELTFQPQTEFSTEELSIPESSATLILCPRHLVMQWRDEIRKVTSVPEQEILCLTNQKAWATVPTRRLLTAHFLIIPYQFFVDFHVQHAMDTSECQNPYQCSRFGQRWDTKLRRIAQNRELWTDVCGGGLHVGMIKFKRIIYDEYHELSTGRDYESLTGVFGIVTALRAQARWGFSATPQFDREYPWKFISGLPQMPTWLRMYNLLPTMFEQRVRIEDAKKMKLPPIEYVDKMLELTEEEYLLYRVEEQGHPGIGISRTRLLEMSTYFSSQEIEAMRRKEERRQDPEGEHTAVDAINRTFTLIERNIAESKRFLYAAYLRIWKRRNTGDMPEGYTAEGVELEDEEKQDVAAYRNAMASHEHQLHFLRTTFAMLQNKDDMAAAECSICYDALATKDHVGLILPCGHFFCYECTQALRNCAFCRKPCERIHKLQPGEAAAKKPRVERRTTQFGTKIDAVVGLVRNNPGRRIICFVEWRRVAMKIMEALRTFEINSVSIFGGTQDLSAAQQFREDPNIRVLFLSSEYVTAGLNLPEADEIVFLHPHSRFMSDQAMASNMERQAISRAQRPGRVNPLRVTRLLAKDTIDEEFPRNHYEDIQYFKV